MNLDMGYAGILKISLFVAFLNLRWKMAMKSNGDIETSYPIDP
jgi:hypothetical protein